MKQVVVVLSLLFFTLPQLSFGQFSLDFSSGLNASSYNFVSTEVTDQKLKLGYFISVAPSYALNEKVRLLANIQYITKGYLIDPDGDLLENRSRYSYLEFIPEVEFSIVSYLSLGLGVAYAIKLKEEFKSGDGDWIDTGNPETISSSDLGITGKLKFTRKKLFAFIRYHVGLVNISELEFTNELGETNEDAKQLTRNAQIGIGYTLSWRKG